VKYLNITYSENPEHPSDGNPYVLYNPDINKVWIFKGRGWILDDAHWRMRKFWSNNGRWNYYYPNVVS
jgi:hypothetical protein